MTPDNKTDNKTSNKASNKASNWKDTPGWRYVAEFLPDMSETDTSWVAEAINAGRIIACPRCHFLHLPRLPFSSAMYHLHGPEPVDACDVCAHLPAVCDQPMPADVGAALDNAVYDLPDERRGRAEVLYTLWMGAYNAADALLMSKLAQERDTLRAFSRTPVADNGEPPAKKEAEQE